MQAQESKFVPDSGPSSASKPKGPRLVIRVKITPEPPPAPPAPSITPRALGLSAAVIALLTLGWFGIRSMQNDAASPSISTASTPRALPSEISALRSEDSAAADASPTGQPPIDKIEATAPIEPATPSPLNEVIPDAPRSALQTITGTVRVAIRVDIDKAGAVVGTHTEIPGPSRYFERLSREAAAKWTFTPTPSGDMRSMLLRFYYKRDGVTAEASLPN